MYDGSSNKLKAFKAILRAHGGCLGTKRRRRTWQAAISFGELHASVITEDFRMGQPSWLKTSYLVIGANAEN